MAKCSNVKNQHLSQLHFGSVLYPQRSRLIGVGRVLEAARKMKESWPIGSPCWILEQNLFLLSSLQASANLFCTVSLNGGQSSHFWVSVLFQMALDALGKVVLLMSISDYLAGRRVLLVAIVIPASFWNAREEWKKVISLIRGIVRYNYSRWVGQN